MTAPRLTSGLRVSALLRRVNAAGGFATVVTKGDVTAGAIALILRAPGDEPCLMVRTFGAAGHYEWTESARGDAIESWATRARQRDPDLWIVELDIPDAARFIAEMTDA